MEPERWGEVDALFAAALERPPQDRPAFLDAACGQGELRRSVDRLLAADDRAGSFLERPPAADLARVEAGEEPAAGGVFGPYRLEEVISRGGMGTVYQAIRDDGQFERRVALKLLHGGWRHPEIRQRFLSERQILARLEHANIARLYDGGESESGVPYLVMELVEGLPIDEYCDRHRLTIEERLRLFRRLSDAVSHAHQNLLVHRDIKPANVLVGADGQPKLLDFGIAKQLEGGVLAPRNQTRPSLRPMTPGYASPEQVRGDAITTASDVYSLGVLLYELLCGRSPYRLETELPHELETAILTQEPERPSQALARPGAGSAGQPPADEIAAARRGSRRELARRLAGDLDTIVGKALRKDPARRYSSVAELDADLERHLKALPVAARPDTLRYRSAKFVRRHRLGVGVAALTAVLIAGLVVSLFRQRGTALRERDRAELALNFLIDTFREANPYDAGAKELTAVDVLDRGTDRIRRGLAGEPEVQASLLDALGQVNNDLRRIEVAEPLLEEALALRRWVHGDRSIEAADTGEHLAEVRVAQGRFQDAADLYQEAVAIKRQRLGPRHLEIAKTLNDMGVAVGQTGKPDHIAAAEALHIEALDIALATEGPDSHEAADALHALALLARERDALDEAEVHARKSLAILMRSLGEENPDTTLVEGTLGLVLLSQTKLREAEQVFRRLVVTRGNQLGEDHPDLAENFNNLGSALLLQGRGAEAETYVRRALARYQQQYGEKHFTAALVLGNVASALLQQGRLEEALPVAEETLTLRRATLGDKSLRVAQTLLMLSELQRGLGRADLALGHVEGARDLYLGALSAEHPSAAGAWTELGRVLLARGDAAQALPHFERAVRIRRDRQPPAHADRAKAEAALGACYLALGRPDEAGPLLTGARSVLAAELAPESRALTEVDAWLAELGRLQGQPVQARKSRAREEAGTTRPG